MLNYITILIFSILKKYRNMYRVLNNLVVLNGMTHKLQHHYFAELYSISNGIDIPYTEKLQEYVSCCQKLTASQMAVICKYAKCDVSVLNNIIHAYVSFMYIGLIILNTQTTNVYYKLCISNSRMSEQNFTIKEVLFNHNCFREKYNFVFKMNVHMN